jgi:hypothetical protein
VARGECSEAGKHGVTAWHSQCTPEEQSAGIALLPRKANTTPAQHLHTGTGLQDPHGSITPKF